MTLSSNQDAFFGRLVTGLHKDRVSYFRVPPEETPGAKTLGAYALNAAACEAFYPLLHGVEVVLRNSLDRMLRGRVRAENTIDIVSWLDRRDSVLSVTAREEVDLAKKKLIDRAGREKRAAPTHSDLVASLDFGFWTGLLSNDYVYRHPGDARWWPQLLPSVLPSYKPISQKVQMKDLHQIRSAFNDIRKFRNSVFHHEKILPRSGLVRLPEVKQDLQTKRAWILNAIGWISPEIELVLSKFARVEEVVEARFYRQLCFRLLQIAS